MIKMVKPAKKSMERLAVSSIMRDAQRSCCYPGYEQPQISHGGDGGLTLPIGNTPGYHSNTKSGSWGVRVRMLLGLNKRGAERWCPEKPQLRPPERESDA